MAKRENPVLRTWLTLNDFLANAGEEDCRKLIREEQKGRNRKQFLLRIHSRLNKVRAHREREELLSGEF